MVSDTVRAAKTAKRQEVVDKYERTYRTNIEDLIAFGSGRDVYEQKVQSIIRDLSGRKDRYYVASFPFFNKMNSVVYDLIHCTGHHLGFDLFKEIAWKTFDDKSSDKHVNKSDDDKYEQIALNLLTGQVEVENHTDDSCYSLKDIALYLQNHFRGRIDVPKDEVIEYISDHPVFPTRNYRKKIWDALKRYYGATVKQQTITFLDRS